ncbi:serine hydrolase domain-containing protein [Nonomuraea sp. NPDC050536]|uniref:serine hydrolase domain-containing protein n=1 Tax=Nonomuraea sp. NPDC050536 TaxID=3364366 RepID=UPI0037C6A858
MSHDKLAEFVRSAAEEFGIPGAAVGVWVGGEEIYACHGVTSIENPLPVDQDTLFQLASITKTYTATALMRLVEAGKVEPAAPVRRYVPEFPLEDERVTVARLLNHTAGLDWAVIVDTGEGDDALAAYVAKMGGLIAPPGSRASYSQAGYNLVGRIIENVTGLPYEKAVAELVLGPAGLENSFFTAQDVITRRFAVGHDLGDHGTLSVARPWKGTRANNPGGGLVSSVADQLRWARYHLGDDPTLRGMREPTVALRASTLGDAIGTAWFLRDVDGVGTVGHGGSANGLFAELLLVPERDFAVVVVSNAGPNGIPFDQAVVRWALEHYLGVIDRDPEPIPYDAARVGEIVGAYDIDAMTLTITDEGQELTLEVLIKPEIRAAAETELPRDHAPFPFGLLPGDTDEYVITDGAFKGQRGFFTRDATGTITGVDLAGRLFNRLDGSLRAG